MLQTAAVSAEALGVLPGSIERGLRERLLPPVELLSKKVGSKARDMPQVRGGWLLVGVWFEVFRRVLLCVLRASCVLFSGL
jgi:hypothetical protein